MSRAQRLYDALTLALAPDALTVDNESSNHRVPMGSETHFKIVAVSAHFNTLTRVARHRVVNTLLKTEFATGLHALSLFLYTPDEWRERNMTAPASPPCHSSPTQAKK